ncbi:alpha/beta fold hydrolase [Halorarius litoreus]|uniref:alpha/beta fold hydrolase n=1 Tax=Halorarius litoreus TaxID=2962676 RepID=UPI0020CF99F7|nr:alpha/beta hydrolase [Halorarius litoreus]
MSPNERPETRTAADRTSVLVLPDDRILSYATYGASDGPTLFFLNGTPGSRLMSDEFDGAMLAAGVRVIVPDRPGMGHSTFQPGRRVVDFADDVDALADDLGLERFPVVGISGGGPFALACGARLTDRVTRIGLVCSLAPRRPLGPRPGASVLDRVRFRSRGLYPVNLAEAIVQWIVTSERGLERVAESLPAPDRETLRDDEFRERASASMREAFRSGIRGVATETHILNGDWGFDLHEVTCPVDVWHGVLDEEVPLRHGEYLAAQLPDATLHVLDDEAHFSMMLRLDEVFPAALGDPTGAADDWRSTA